MHGGDSSMHGGDSSMHGGNESRAITVAGNGSQAIRILDGGCSIAELAFFADIASHEAAVSRTIVRVLSLPKAAWEVLMEQFPQQARLVLENLQVRGSHLLAARTAKRCTGSTGSRCVYA